jgi:hypothetical protein
MWDSFSNLTLVVLVVIGVLFLPQMFSSVGEQDSVAATSPSRAAFIFQQHPDWPAHYCQRLADGIVTEGMTVEMVQLTWGDPAETRRDGSLLLLSYRGFLSESGGLIRSPANRKELVVNVMLGNGIVTSIEEFNTALIN